MHPEDRQQLLAMVPELATDAVKQKKLIDEANQTVEQLKEDLLAELGGEPLYRFYRFNIMWLHPKISITTELVLLAEFLISFAVPFGLVWLLYFITTRFIIRDFVTSE